MVRSCPLCRQRVNNGQSRRTNFSLLSLIEKLERLPAPERVHQQTQTDADIASTNISRPALSSSSFFDGKRMTVAVKKTGLHLAIK